MDKCIEILAWEESSECQETMLFKERLSDGNKKWQGCLIHISVHRKSINAVKDTAQK